MKHLATTAAVAAALLATTVFAQANTGAPWGAGRGPATCTPLKQPKAPSPAQAAQLLRCAKERIYDSSGELWLLKSVNVEVGGPTAFRALYNIVTMPEADTTKQVHPIRGDFTWSVCTWLPDTKNPGKNCAESTVSNATGACWRTTFGDWKCTMNGTTGARTAGLPPVK